MKKKWKIFVCEKGGMGGGGGAQKKSFRAAAEAMPSLEDLSVHLWWV